MPHPRYLRVVSFRPGVSESAFDAGLRDTVLPRMLDDDRVVDVWVGRRGSRDDRARVLASTWIDDPETPLGAPIDVAGLRALGGHDVIVDGVEQAPLLIHASFERPEPTRVLRLFHGRVRPGELDAYIEVARAEVLADVEANDGLIGFALGARPPDSFTTVSVWTGWPAIEAATGGNTRTPFVTRNSELLAEFTVAHFEVLPDAGNRAPDRG